MTRTGPGTRSSGLVKERASDDGTVRFSNLVLLAVGRA